ncbi:ATP-binding cassette sub-family A member 1-like protein, partial [Dinothrombium tinctorium]
FELVLPLITSTILASIYSSTYKSGTPQEQPTPGYHPPVEYKQATFDFIKALASIPTEFYRNHTVPILYTPINEFTKNMTEEMNQVIRSLLKFEYEKPIHFTGFINEDEMVAAYLNSTRYNPDYKPIAGIVFFTEILQHDSKQQLEKNIRYKIRVSKIYSEDTTKMFPMKSSPAPFDHDTNYRFHFAPLQILINEAYLNLVARNQSKERLQTANFFAFKLPYPRYMVKPKTAVTVVDQIPLIVVFGFIVTSPIIVKRLADEKISRCREMFRLMGLSDWVYWGSTFVNYFVIYIFQAMVLTIIYMTKFNGINALINYASWFVIFISFIIYGIQFIMQAMMLSIPFSKPVFGVIITVIYWMVSYMLPVYFLDPSVSTNIDVRATDFGRVMSCLLPNMALHFTFRVVSQKEVYGSRSDFANLFEEVAVFGSLSHGLIILMMLLSTFISGLLIWYLEAVWPWQYGVPKPFYFPCLPSFWCKKLVQIEPIAIEKEKNEKFFERQLDSSEVAICVKDLCKHFGVGVKRKTAINNASLSINYGQITVLLGHNGAGKTTLMNIITGILTPSSGTVFVNGYDVGCDTKAARESISLCPQHNVLYDELSVMEHLKLYAAIKGTEWSSINQEISSVLDQVRLMEKRNVASCTLSGGMKRKLSLAIALIGNTKIVILDEPTSGMDPDARRTVWDLLQSVRRHRTILLTTHYMEEADALGDRIAIMADGEVKCCGTPMFLKRAFGGGYQLRIAKGSDFKKESFERILRNFFADASIVNEIYTEIVYDLEDGRNNESDSTKVFTEFFETFEIQKEDFGIASCGLSVTTIEDVFLRVNSMSDELKNSNTMSNLSEIQAKPLNNTIDQYSVDASESFLVKLNGNFLFLQQLKGLMIKRFQFSSRYLPMIIFQLIVPSLIFMLLLYLDWRLKRKDNGSTNLYLDLREMYGSTITFYQPLEEVSNLTAFSQYYEATSKNEAASTFFIPKEFDPNKVLINKTEEISVNEYIRTYIIGATANYSRNELFTTGRIYNAWYNNEALHSLPASINTLYNAILKEIVNSNSSEYSIGVSVEPFPTYDSFNYDQFYILIGLQAMWSVIVPLSLPFLAASYVLFPIHERASKSKLLQLMTGLYASVYWLINFIFDISTHFICCFLIFSIFAMMDINRIFFGHTDSSFALFTLLFLFGFTSIPMAYTFSFLPKKASTGFAVIVILLLVCGVIVSIVDFVLLIVVAGKVISQSVYDFISSIFRIFPIMSMTKGVLKLYLMSTSIFFCNRIPLKMLDGLCDHINEDNKLFGCCTGIFSSLGFVINLKIFLGKCEAVDKCYKYENPWQWGSKGILDEVALLIVAGITFFIILTLLESDFARLSYQFFGNRFKKLNIIQTYKRELNMEEASVTMYSNSEQMEDSDVLAEKRRVEEILRNSFFDEEAFIVSNLTKKFKNLVAVNGLTFGVHNQECFGLLGVNGAGKTSTFRMLVGDLLPSEGNAFCAKYDLRTSLKHFQQQIGYCPQYDALLGKLTGTETLYLFGRLRGISECELKSKVEELIIMTDLSRYADKRTETYSGGNQRKLSLAIALIGSPRLLFLDEPSSGVDPSARRKIWRTLAYIRNHYGCSIVLTSHSMDECEALCGRIAIMVNGEFKCLGNFQHLRSKFGQGFTLRIKAKRDNLNSEYISSLKNYIEQIIPSAILKDRNETILEYHVTDTQMRWSSLFRAMADVKENFDLEDFTISDTTLEQIFILFARQQQQV